MMPSFNVGTTFMKYKPSENYSGVKVSCTRDGICARPVPCMPLSNFTKTKSSPTVRESVRYEIQRTHPDSSSGKASRTLYDA